MEHSVVMPLGIVLEEQEDAAGPSRWRPVRLIPGAAPLDAWLELERGEGWVRWHAGTLQLELQRREIDGYRASLVTDPPVVFVVLHEGSSDDGRARPYLTTLLRQAADRHAREEGGRVEAVPMPDGLNAWVQAFIDRHQGEDAARLRKRRRFDAADGGIGRRPERFGGPGSRARGRPGRA